MFHDDEDEELAEMNAYKTWPIFVKAMEIVEVARRVADVIEEAISNSELGDMGEVGMAYVSILRENSFIIPVKIAGSSVPVFDLKMENAAIIRKAAREIQTTTSGIRMLLHDKDSDYLQLLRDHIEEFRILFAEWVKGFDSSDYFIDRWGLFNPPGVNYDDHDPDDDIPFDPESDREE